MRKTASLIACFTLAAAAYAYAQSPNPSAPAPSGHTEAQHHHPLPAAAEDTSKQTLDDNSLSSQAFRDANARMHAAMDIKMTGDADLDFVRGMIAHHQGAVDMAKILLVYGKDDELRRLAQSIVKDQEREIAQMQAWLKKRGG